MMDPAGSSQIGYIRDYLYLIPLSPLCGAVLCGLVGPKLKARAVDFIACISVALSFLLSVWAAAVLISLKHGQEPVVVQVLYQWISIPGPGGGLDLNVSFLLDPLACVMGLVVSGVGLLIHVYSVGYMAGDPGKARYFCYLNLFTFSMLLLVMAENVLLMYVGWEGVGLCSYLLIGFWYSDLANARAGMKAFVTNRVGDFGFLVGLLLLFATLQSSEGASGSLSFLHIKEMMPHIVDAKPLLGVSVATWVTLLFFIGATGKSAQIPLFVWLPDAMAGPTPVSALIHAATMVTAGVYMIVRLGFLYLASPVALTVVAVVGTATAFFSATMAVTEYDIKRVLAYSTISQLGYMFMAVGVAAFSAGIFHLITHAFFKALLFLAAGNVIHAVGYNDIRKMGGLRKTLPVTCACFFAAYLAISGVPPLSGFMSKDSILFETFQAQLVAPWAGKVLWTVGLVTAGMTAFYMTRLFSLTFAGSFRADGATERQLHESPRVMTVPLIILALCAVTGGLIGLPEITGLSNWLEAFLSPVTGAGQVLRGHPHGTWVELLLMTGSVGATGVGIYLGWLFYRKDSQLPIQWSERLGRVYLLVRNKYRVDEAYARVFVRPCISLAGIAARLDLQRLDAIVNGSARLTAAFSKIVGFEDFRVVDGLVQMLSDFVHICARRLERLQTGRLHQYLFSVVVSLFVLYILFTML